MLTRYLAVALLALAVTTEAGRTSYNRRDNYSPRSSNKYRRTSVRIDPRYSSEKRSTKLNYSPEYTNINNRQKYSLQHNIKSRRENRNDGYLGNNHVTTRVGRVTNENNIFASHKASAINNSQDNGQYINNGVQTGNGNYQRW